MISTYVWRDVLLRSQWIRITTKTFSCTSISKSTKKPPTDTTTEAGSLDASKSTREPDRHKYDKSEESKDSSQSFKKNDEMKTQIAELDKILKFYVKEKTRNDDKKNVRLQGLDRLVQEYNRDIETQELDRSTGKNEEIGEPKYLRRLERSHQQGSRVQASPPQQWKKFEETLDSSLTRKKNNRKNSKMQGLERLLQKDNRTEDIETKQWQKFDRNNNYSQKQQNKKNQKISLPQLERLLQQSNREIEIKEPLRKEFETKKTDRKTVTIQGLERLLQSENTGKNIETKQWEGFEKSPNPLANEEGKENKTTKMVGLERFLHKDYSEEGAGRKEWKTHPNILDTISGEMQKNVKRDTKLVGLERLLQEGNRKGNMKDGERYNVDSIAKEKMKNVRKGLKLLGLERLTENYNEEEEEEEGEESGTQQWRKKSDSQGRQQQGRVPAQPTLNIPEQLVQLFDEFKFKEKIESYKPNPNLPAMEIWNTLDNIELQQNITHSPRSALEEIMMWTEQGKMWKFPIDNEQGMEDEQNVHFSKHIFLDQHLEGWCPTEGPIRHFMELVCIGLSKNPYLSVEEKIRYITWYKNYFTERVPLLEGLGVWDNGCVSLPESKET